MKIFTKIVALTLFSLPLLANAAGKTASATMQVTFEVKESCSVQTTPAADKNAKAAPAVACQLNTPYQAQQTAASSTAATTATPTRSETKAADGVWTITF
ncbi:hypothetical protein SAMN05216319_4629 [Duganella sp. CF402]|uniref:hypothetical protein n=1 Tax=unclassified Duganella TaxID=2636909 RepID=UPI0008D1EC7E|nr:MULTISPECIES: hypothetical protein [unclassified Duganella]RZT06146.1 hypothetical protein EV582_4472 [Duganella sp. BK701]SEM74377.1 hypothetical protein SAMN05216319_4629 [Duganella sp. CF402]